MTAIPPKPKNDQNTPETFLKKKPKIPPKPKKMIEIPLKPKK